LSQPVIGSVDPASGDEVSLSFESLGLGPDLCSSLRDLGFELPTPIQARAIPSVLLGQDVIGIAQTGTGKTAAYVLPLIQRLGHGGGLRILVLSPTRELTLQICSHALSMGRLTGFQTISIIGGESFGTQNRELDAAPDMVVGTPGRVYDQIRRGRLPTRNIEVLVLDEADRLLDMGFAPQIEEIVRQIPRRRQTLLFSATMPSGIQALARSYLHEPQEIVVGPVLSAVDTCHQELYVATPREKVMLLKYLLHREQGSVLVFTRTKRGADEVEHLIRHSGRGVAALHADRSQDERKKAMNGFREGKYGVLVATDLAARGLDVDGITLVINFDVPPTAEDYLHRIGRTARAQRTGRAYTFATIDDLTALRNIETRLGKKLPFMVISREDLNAFAREEASHEHSVSGNASTHDPQPDTRDRRGSRASRTQGARSGRGRRHAPRGRG